MGVINMLSIARSFVCSIFLLITFSFIPNASASCGKSVPLQSTFHNALQGSQSTLSKSETESFQNNTEFLEALKAKALKPNELDEDLKLLPQTIVKISDTLLTIQKIRNNFRKVLDAFTTLMTTKKMIYLATYNPAQFHEIITITLVQLTCNSENKKRSLLEHPIVSSILLVLAYRMCTIGVVTLADPWVALSIIGNGLSCSTIARLINRYGPMVTKASLNRCQSICNAASSHLSHTFSRSKQLSIVQ